MEAVRKQNEEKILQLAERKRTM